MKHKRKPAGFTVLGKWRIFLILALILALSIILIAGGNNEVPVQVIGGDVELRVFGRHENNIVMLLEDSGKLLAYYKDGSSTDSKLTPVDVVEDGRAFFLDGGTLGIGQCDEMSFNTSLYSLESHLQNFKTDMHGLFPEESDKLVFSNAGTEQGTHEYIIYILSSNGELWQCESLSEPEETGIADVEFLDSTQGGWVYMYTGGVLYRWRGGDMDGSELFLDAPCPSKLVGEDVYIDESGMIVRIRNGSIEQVAVDIDVLNPLACLGTDSYLFAADSSGVVHKYDWSGEEVIEVETANTEGYVCGIVEDYALIIKDEMLCLTRLIFREPDREPEPTPEPTDNPGETEEPSPEPTAEQTPDNGEEESPSSEPESSSEPEPSNEPEESPGPTPGGNDEVGKIIERCRFRELSGNDGKYISVLSGSRISDLRKIYAPQSIEAFNQDGGAIHEAVLKTGMKIRLPYGDGSGDEITIVIRADCTGDGKVLESDIVFASLYYLDVQEVETEAQYLAMDMNEDGVVTIHDLPGIATEIKRMESKISK